MASVLCAEHFERGRTGPRSFGSAEIPDDSEEKAYPGLGLSPSEADKMMVIIKELMDRGVLPAEIIKRLYEPPNPSGCYN